MTTEENQGHPHMITNKPGDPKMSARATEPIVIGSRQTPTLHRDGVATGTPPSQEFSNPYERAAEVTRVKVAQEQQDKMDNRKMIQSDNSRKGGVETPTVKTKKAAVGSANKPPSEKFIVTKTKTKAKAATKAKAKPKAKSTKSPKK